MSDKLVGDDLVVAAWGSVALKMVLIHAHKRTGEHRARRERVFKFISGKTEFQWAKEKGYREWKERQEHISSAVLVKSEPHYDLSLEVANVNSL